MNRVLLTMAMLAAASFFTGCQAIDIDRPYQPQSHHLGYDRVFGGCDSCSTCGGDCGGHSPASYIGHNLTCASGCGEFYWGEWFSDPPDDCDPCDDCGNWIGERCCPPTWKERLRAGIAGQWFTDGGAKGSKSGCGCGGKGCAACDAEWMNSAESTIIEGPAHEVIPPEAVPAVREPTPPTPRTGPLPNTPPGPEAAPLTEPPAPPGEEMTPAHAPRSEPRSGLLPPLLRPRQTSGPRVSVPFRLPHFAR